MSRICSLMLFWAVWLPISAGAADHHELRFNPFEAPALSDLAAGGSAEASGNAWQPLLRATLRAGAASLADLGGVVLVIGEETHGYRLLEVSEFSAVFERNGERVELEIPAPASLEE